MKNVNVIKNKTKVREPWIQGKISQGSQICCFVGALDVIGDIWSSEFET